MNVLPAAWVMTLSMPWTGNGFDTMKNTHRENILSNRQDSSRFGYRVNMRHMERPRRCIYASISIILLLGTTEDVRVEEPSLMTHSLQYGTKPSFLYSFIHHSFTFKERTCLGGCFSPSFSVGYLRSPVLTLYYGMKVMTLYWMLLLPLNCGRINIIASV